MDKPADPSDPQTQTDSPETAEPASAPFVLPPSARSAPRFGWLPRTALELTQMVANLAVIAALVFTAIAYWNQQNEARRTEAAQMVSNLHSERMASARSILFRLWADKDLTVFDAGVSASFRQSLVRKTIETSQVPETDVIEAIVSITNFYDEVEICVSMERCDRKEIDANLGRYGQSFYCLYRSEIDQLRAKLALPNLGNDLALLVERQGGC